MASWTNTSVASTRWRLQRDITLERALCWVTPLHAKSLRISVCTLRTPSWRRLQPRAKPSGYLRTPGLSTSVAARRGVTGAVRPAQDASPGVAKQPVTDAETSGAGLAMGTVLRRAARKTERLAQTVGRSDPHVAVGAARSSSGCTTRREARRATLDRARCASLGPQVSCAHTNSGHSGFLANVVGKCRGHTLRAIRTVSFIGFIVCLAAQVGPARPFPQSLWRVDPVPLVDIAGSLADGQHMFSHPIGAIRLPHGRIVVADAHGGSVYFFDAAGGELYRATGSGVGPGTFHHVAWIGRCGADSVFVWDLMRQRMIVLNEAGSFVREDQFPATEVAEARTSIVACSHQGVFVSQPVPRTLLSLPIGRGRAPLAITDSRGQIQRLLND